MHAPLRGQYFLYPSRGAGWDEGQLGAVLSIRRLMENPSQGLLAAYTIIGAPLCEGRHGEGVLRGGERGRLAAEGGSDGDGGVTTGRHNSFEKEIRISSSSRSC
jgi:hypothetical protein